MLLGIIADDFTGASDIANTLAQGLPGSGGLKTVQYLGVPKRPAAPGVEAGVVSLKSRSIPAADAIALSLQAFDWLKAQGCEQFVFKFCSTFDSTPAGNIGPVGDAIAARLNVKGVPNCPAYPTLNRTVYMGHLFVGDRLLSESGMEKHPLNPMTDPDLRRWLKLQSASDVGFVPWAVVAAGEDKLRAALADAAARGQTQVIVDCVRNEDLLVIARACRDVPLLCGGSGISLGLPGNFIAAGKASGAGTLTRRIEGPEAILAGSCSGATRKQVEVHTKTHPALTIDAESVMAGKISAGDIVAFVRQHAGAAPLVYSSDAPDRVAAVQAKYGREKVSAALEKLFADTAKALVEGGVRRLVVAGGETSGAVVTALGLDALAIGREIDPGVPVLVSEGETPLALALKSGNFGAPDFFDKALNLLRGQA